jgi:hypothetical protein
MHSKHICGLVVALAMQQVAAAPAMPQGPIGMAGDSRTDPGAAQALLATIGKQAGGPSGEPGTVIDILNQGLPATAANVATVRDLLAVKSNAETRVMLTSLLGSLYTRGDRAGSNAIIEKTLREQIRGADRRLATAAILTYVRTAFHPDAIELLDYSFSRGLLAENDYTQELAIGLPLAPRMPSWRRQGDWNARTMRSAQKSWRIRATVLSSWLA